MQASLFLHRVPSAPNIADPPSRNSFVLMNDIGVVFCEPCFDARFLDPHEWSALDLLVC